MRADFKDEAKNWVKNSPLISCNEMLDDMRLDTLESDEMLDEMLGVFSSSYELEKNIDKALQMVSASTIKSLKTGFADGVRIAVFKIFGAGDEQKGGIKFLDSWFIPQKEFDFLYSNMPVFKEFADSIHPSRMKKIKSSHRWAAAGSIKSGIASIYMYILIIPLFVIIPLKIQWEKKMTAKTTDEFFNQILWACKESGWLQDEI